MMEFKFRHFTSENITLKAYKYESPEEHWFSDEMIVSWLRNVELTMFVTKLKP